MEPYCSLKVATEIDRVSRGRVVCLLSMTEVLSTRECHVTVVQNMAKPHKVLFTVLVSTLQARCVCAREDAEKIHNGVAWAEGLCDKERMDKLVHYP